MIDYITFWFIVITAVSVIHDIRRSVHVHPPEHAEVQQQAKQES